MTIEKIRELCNAEPFRPFVIHFPGGRRLPVEHPDYIALAPSGRLISVFKKDDSEALVDLPLISDITVKSRSGNGAKGHH